MQVGSRRLEYAGAGLGEGQLAATPYEQITRWVQEARARQEERGDVPEPGALSVATVDEHGPDVRTVLMRFLDPRGPGFVTNLESIKGRQLLADPRVAAGLTWPSMFRAIRFRGVAERIERETVEAYFQQRPWGARISAWASDQSQPIADRAKLEAAHREYAERFPDRGKAEDVPVPSHFGAFRVRPDRVEFWAGRVDRLHDRLVLTRTGPGDLSDATSWELTRLQP